MAEITFAVIFVVRFFFAEIRQFFRAKCPDCGGIMKSTIYDMHFDKSVYECQECHKEWM